MKRHFFSRPWSKLLLKTWFGKLIVFLVILLTLAAALPLLGYDLIMRDLKIVSLNDYPAEIQHLVVTRSAAFATLRCGVGFDLLETH